MNWTRIETPHGLEIPEIEYARMLDALPEPERTMRLAQVPPGVRLDAGIHLEAAKVRALGFGMTHGRGPGEWRCGE